MTDHPAIDRLHDDVETDRVVLRRWKDSPREVIALLVDLPGTSEPWTCTTYEHTGQHGHGHVDAIIDRTEPIHVLDCPTAADARALLAEMRGIGYKLRVVRRVPSNATERRRAVLAEMRR